MSETILLVHAGATWFMVGLIWFVQIVHYPLFAAVGEDRWIAYEARHQRRTTIVVIPVMLVELITAVMLAVGAGVERAPAILAWNGIVLLAIIWGSTFAVQVPLHARLARQHAPRTVRTLVLTNWVRTFAWSARGGLALALLR